MNKKSDDSMEMEVKEKVGILSSNTVDTKRHLLKYAPTSYRHDVIEYAFVLMESAVKVVARGGQYFACLSQRPPPLLHGRQLDFRYSSPCLITPYSIITRLWFSFCVSQSRVGIRPASICFATLSPGCH